MSEASATPARAYAVVDGEIKAFSASQGRLYMMCPRAWHFNKVQRKKMPQTKAANEGDQHHKRVETYLNTGLDVLDKWERIGVQHMPIPGPDLLVEEKFGETPLEAEGVKFTGKIDCITPRELPHGVLKIQDWKFSGEPRKWSAKAEELTDVTTDVGFQTVGYAKWALNARARFGWNFEQLELEHVYFAMKGRPDSFPVRARIDVESVERQWEDKVRPLMREIKDVAKETDWTKVPAATDEQESCRKYGRLCPFYAECKGAFALIAGANTSRSTNKGK